MKHDIYKAVRKSCNLTRDKVCEIASETNYPIQPERLERIENGRFDIKREEVMLLSDIYKTPSLCNYYCINQCIIGKKYSAEVKTKDLSQIVLEILASVNSVKKNQERLVDITVDGVIDDEELQDFIDIENDLKRISSTVEGLKYWIEEMIINIKINIERYREIKGEID